MVVQAVPNGFGFGGRVFGGSKPQNETRPKRFVRKLVCETFQKHSKTFQKHSKNIAKRFKKKQNVSAKRFKNIANLKHSKTEAKRNVSTSRFKTLICCVSGPISGPKRNRLAFCQNQNASKTSSAFVLQNKFGRKEANLLKKGQICVF